jgi:hypothetical protein
MMYVLARALSRTLWQQMGSISGSPSGSCQDVPSRAQFVLRAVRRSVASGAYGERGACLVGSGAGAGPPRPLRSRSLSTHPASNATVMVTRTARASMEFSQLIATASLLVATSTHARDPKSRLAEECGNSWLGVSGSSVNLLFNGMHRKITFASSPTHVRPAMELFTYAELEATHVIWQASPSRLRWCGSSQHG